MSGIIRSLCVLSVFFSAVMLIIPEGSVKKLSSVLCTVILFSVLLEAAGGFSFDTYAEAIAGYREKSAALSADARSTNRELNRLVIEESCQSYIRDKGSALGLRLHSVKVQVEWSMDGVWYPTGAHIVGEGAANEAFISSLEAELGIPEDRIVWETA